VASYFVVEREHAFSQIAEGVRQPARERREWRWYTPGVTPTDSPRRRFTTPVRVRYADTDATGTLYPTSYLVYFEVARVEALRGLGVPVGEFVTRGVAMPVVEAGITVLLPPRVDDLLDVDVLLDRIGPASFSFDYEVVRGGVLLATGFTRMAVIEPESGRALRLPDWVRELLLAVGG
jgi:acyl-CoA thioester hydrolase